MSKKIYFNYLITNLINGKQYVGDHSTENMTDSLTKNYKGSGDIIKKALKKYGRENFKREILEYFDTKEESFKSQEKYIRLYETHVSQNGYNISWTGGTDGFGGKHSDESKRKMSENNSGMKGKKHSAKTKLKMSESQKKLNKKLSQETIGKIKDSISGEKHPNWGKNRSKETIERIRKSNKKRYQDPKLRKELSEKISKNMKKAEI